MKLLQKLWADEAGFIISAELVLVATIVVIGLIVGLATVRNQIVQELVDVGQAIGSISQSYAYGAVNGAATHSCGWTDGSGWYDVPDFCQVQTQAPGAPAGGIDLVSNPANFPTTAPFTGG